MGAYLDSAACVNREPTRVIFHPVLQKMSLDGHTVQLPKATSPQETGTQADTMESSQQDEVHR